LKKTQVQILKKKQLAWVKENLNIDKSRIEKRKEKLKLMKEKEDLDKMTAIQNENLRFIEKRKTMKKNWLRRQKIKRDLEIKRKEQLLMDQQLLDELSKKRECDNQIRYNLWKKSKDDAKKKQKLFEIEKLNETNIMLMVDHVNNNSDNSDNSTSTRSNRSNNNNNNNNNFDDDFNNHDSKRGRKYTKEERRNTLHGLHHGYDDDNDIYWKRLSVDEMEKRHMKMQKKQRSKRKKKAASIERKRLLHANESYQKIIGKERSRLYSSKNSFD
jgi:hypothetical protein